MKIMKDMKQFGRTAEKICFVARKPYKTNFRQCILAILLHKPSFASCLL